ncbi:VOC family protein [Alteribacter aurantiacus]|uniref:VOC family protein n=1 Tax=Alteribacter aurantiacus TaxID=254410 RepID=UPI0003FB4E60|nr:VOC family protein [Alteribacter aurantiacus]
MFNFDHIIHYVSDAHKTKEAFQEKGFHAVNGGRHEEKGTYNTLCHFDLSYIEFLGIDDKWLFEKVHKEKSELSPFSTILQDGYVEGFSKIALRTRNLDNLASILKEKGLTVTGPVPLSRKRPDGSVLEWSLLFVEDEKSDMPLPFFIDWHQSDEERREDLVSHGVMDTNKDRDSSLSHVTFAIKDLEQTVAKWALLFGLPTGEPYVDDRLGARVQRIHLKGGDLLFASPKEDGLVSHILETRGERPFEVHIHADQGEEESMIHGGVYRFQRYF